MPVNLPLSDFVETKNSLETTSVLQISCKNTGCPKVRVIFDPHLFSELGGQIMKSFGVLIQNCARFFLRYNTDRFLVRLISNKPVHLELNFTLSCARGRKYSVFAGFSAAAPAYLDAPQ